MKTSALIKDNVGARGFRARVNGVGHLRVDEITFAIQVYRPDMPEFGFDSNALPQIVGKITAVIRLLPDKN